MNTITIPRDVTKGEELVIIPRKIYEALLRPAINEKKNIVVKRTMKVPKRHEKFYDALDKKLTAALNDGEFVGPFDSVEELRKSLEQ